MKAENLAFVSKHETERQKFSISSRSTRLKGRDSRSRLESWKGPLAMLWSVCRKPQFLPNKIPDYCWLLSASGHLVSLSCAQSLNWNYWLTRITEQRLILFQILKSYWNDFPLYNKDPKIFECGDQIIPIPNQRNNCNVCLRLRKEIPVNSAKIQEFVQPLTWSHNEMYVIECWC